MYPLVSVMIPYYNDEKFLNQSIDSVLKQSYDNLELILINHTCTDRSREIAHSYSDARIRHIDLEKNMGAGGAIIFQEFFNHAKGEYVKMFCADDILVPNAIETLVRHMQANPEIDLLGGAMQYVDENLKNTTYYGENTYEGVLHSREKTIQLLVNARTFFAYPTVIMKREVALKSVVNPVLVYLADVQLWLSLALQGYKLSNINELICYYRVHSEQTSAIGTTSQRESIIQFEYPTFCEDIFKLQDAEIIKIICEESPYVDLIDKINPELYPFVLYHKFLYFSGTCTLSEHAYIKTLCFTKLSEMLADKNYREEVEKIFNFTLADLRTLYRSEKFFNTTLQNNGFKRKKSKLSRFFKAINPFTYWKNHKYWKNKIRTSLGIQK